MQANRIPAGSGTPPCISIEMAEAVFADTRSLKLMGKAELPATPYCVSPQPLHGHAFAQLRAPLLESWSLVKTSFCRNDAATTHGSTQECMDSILRFDTSASRCYPIYILPLTVSY